MSTTDILDLVKKVKSESPAGAFSPVDENSLVYGQQQSNETVDPSLASPVARDVLRLVGKVKQSEAGGIPGVAQGLTDSQVKPKYDSREQAIIDRNIASPNIEGLSGDEAGQIEIQQRRKQRAYAEQAPPEVVQPVKDMLSSLGKRRELLAMIRSMTPEQRDEALRLAPGVAQQMGDDRGGVVGRTLGALSRGVSHGVSQPIMELIGIGGTQEEIDYIRKLDAAAAQEFAPARPGDPWYESGPLQATQMAPWMATTILGGIGGKAVATGGKMLLAGKALSGSANAKAAYGAATALGGIGTKIGLPRLTASKAGELAGITAAAFPGQYAQEVDSLKEIGMQDDWKLRLLAGGTATVGGLIEGVVPNPLKAGGVTLKEGAMKAARQYLWEAIKRAPGELGEEYLQGVTSGLGSHIAQYIDENAKDKTVADAFMNGWEQTKDAALPMAFLLGVPAAGGAGLSAIRARKYQLDQIQAKGFVSESDAKEAGIDGASRRDRMANLEAERQDLDRQEQELVAQSDQEFIQQQQAGGMQVDESGQFVPQVSQADLDREFAQRMAAQGGNIATPQETDTEIVSPQPNAPSVEPAAEQQQRLTVNDTPIPKEYESLFNSDGVPLPWRFTMRFGEANGLGATGVRALQSAVLSGSPISVEQAKDLEAEEVEKKKQAFGQYKKETEEQNARDLEEQRLKPRETRTSADYQITTGDKGEFAAKVIRSSDGSVAIFADDFNVIKHSAAFAKGKTDEELMAYSFEPVGFIGARKLVDSATSAEPAAEQPAPSLTPEQQVESDRQFAEQKAAEQGSIAPQVPVIKQRLKNAVRFAPDTVIPEGVPSVRRTHPVFGDYVEVSTAYVDRIPGYSADIESQGAGVKPPEQQPAQVEAPEVPVVSSPEQHAALPMYGVYETTFRGKKQYAVKSFDKGGFGDSLFDSLEDARKNSELEIRRSNDISSALGTAEAAAKDEAKKKADYEASFKGFLSTDPKTKGRQLKVLGGSRQYNGKVVTVKDLIEQKIAGGAVVNASGQLESPDGAYLGSDKITKIGVDYARHLLASRTEAETPGKPDSTQSLEFNVGQGARPIPGMESDEANYTVLKRKPDVIPDTFKVVISGKPFGKGWLSVDGTGTTGEEAYRRAFNRYMQKRPGELRDKTRKADIRRAIEEQGGFENNSADDVEAIRRKLYDGADTPTGTEIRAVIDEMKVEAGRKLESEQNAPESELQPAPQGKTEGFRSLPEKSRSKFEDLWNADDTSIKDALDMTNKAWRAEFEARTGLTLPKTKKGTAETVEKWHAEGRKLAEDKPSEQPETKPTAAVAAPTDPQAELEDDQLPPSAIGYMVQGDRLKGEMWRSPTIGGQSSKYGAFYAANEEGAGKYSRGVGVNAVVAQMVELNDPLVVDTKQQAMEELGIDEDSLQDPSETQDIHHYIDIAIFEEATRKGYDGVVYKQEGYDGNPFEVHVFNPPDIGELPSFTVQGKKQNLQPNEKQSELPAPSKLLDELESIEELRAVLENWSSDDKRPKNSYSLKELIDLAKSRLQDFKLESGNELAEDLAGQNGEDAKKYAISQKNQIKAWIKKADSEEALQATKASDSKPKPPTGYKPLEEFTPMITQTLSPDLELEENRNGIKDLALKQGEAVGYRVYPKRGSKKGGYWQYGTVRYEPSGSHASIELADGTIESVGGSRLVRLEPSTATPEVEQDLTEGQKIALSALDAMLASEKPKEPPKPRSVRKEPEKTKQGQYVLPIMPGMAAEIDRQDFVRRYRDQALEPLWGWSNKEEDAEGIQMTIDTLAPIYSEIFNDIYAGKRETIDDVFDSEPYERILNLDNDAIAVSDALIMNRLDEQINAALQDYPKKAAKKPTRKSKQTLEEAKSDMQAAHDAAASVMEKIRNKLMSGIDPEISAEVVRVAYLYTKAGIKTFKGYVETIVEHFGEAFAREFGPYMQDGWTALNIRGLVSDPTGKVEDYLAKEAKEDYGTPEKPNRIALGRHFYEKLKGGASYPRITDARKEASELLGGSPKDGSSAIKDIDESVEIGVVLAARDIAQSGASDEDIYDQLVDLYGRQPNLANRTSTSMKEQAYSTPAPLAFIANRRVGVTTDDTVYDSSAGNGMLLIVGGKRYANELNEDRAESLRSQGVDTHLGDATSYSIDKPIDALVINPPFGTVEDANGKTISWNIGGVRTEKIDHAISMRSLADIPENGKAVIVIAAKGFEKSEPKSDSARGAAYLAEKRFYDHIYDNYNVTDHFTVHGDLYRKQGASFPVDVIVISGKGKSQRPKPYNIVGKGIPEVIRTWEELKDAKLRPVSSVSSTSVTGGEGIDSGSVVAGDATATTKDAERVPAGTPGKRMGAKDGGKPESQKLGGADGQPRAPDKVDGKNAVGGLAPKTERTGAGGGLRDAGRPSGSARRDSLKPDESAETDFQVSYSPGSKNKSVDTLIPRNHQAAVEKSLDAIAEVYGDIDEFVAKELGYEMDEFENVFSAEQVDALAMAIARHKDGGAFIIGDQTGVGKGRAAAAMMVYANRNGMVPVFITEKPTLYADMIRDLIDIGRSTEDAPFNLLMTNALSGKDAIPLPDGRVLRQSQDAAKSNLSEAVASVLNGDTLSVEGKPIGRGKKKTAGERVVYNAVFTTYSQLQPVKQMAPERARLLKSISSQSFFILDESHNAGGGSDSEPDANQDRRNRGLLTTITRAEIVRDLISEAAGLYFSSATYAKRPQTMGLYAKTGMTAATNGDPNALSEAIATGGVPLQQVVSEQLVESGMYLRRERSFDGVEFNPKTVDVDLKNLDNISSIFSAINFFDGFAQEAIQSIADEITSAGGTIAETEATGQAGLESTSFSSILHNLVDQMLLAVKADSVANEAIDSIKNGESPVIYVDSTLEAALKRQVEETGASQGEEIDFSYKDLVRRYLERSREYTTRTNADDPDSVVRIRLTDQQLGEDGVLAYERAMEMIESFSGDMPASPIDWIRKRITDAGYSVGEITGRQVILEYQDDGTVKLGRRSEEEEGSGGRTTTVSRFNSGDLDAVLINQSGSTGISMHASEKFKNQKPRHMIIGQPARNIDTFMQSLGRVHRTGQIVLPRFTLLMTNAPAEIRPASVLMKKLSSLNANVTASAKGSVSFDAPDVINIVGDQVVAEYLADNLELDRHLGELVQLRRDGTPKRNPGIAKKASGRMALRPVSEQKDFWDSVIATYDELISELNRVGKNPLLASTLDLNAKTIEAVTIFDGDEGSANLFMHPASIETIVANKPGKPMTSEEVKDAVEAFYGKPATDEVVENWLESIENETRAAAEEYLDNVVGKGLPEEESLVAKTRWQLAGASQFDSLMRRLKSFAPGKSVSVYERSSDGTMLEVIPGFVTKVKKLKGGNPLAASKWMVDIAVASPDRIAKTALSRTGQQEIEAGAAGGTYKEFIPNNELLGESRLREFDDSDASTTEIRHVGVGNILAAYAQLGPSGGQVTFFTDTEGKIRRGVLMPRSFRLDRWEEARPVVLDNVDQAHEFLSSGGQLTTPDRVLSLMLVRGELIARAPKAKSKSGKYTINPGILDAASPQEFGSIGNRMEMAIAGEEKQKQVLSAIMQVASLQAVGQDKPLARNIKAAAQSKSQSDLDKGLRNPPDVLYQTEPDIDATIRSKALDLGIAANKQGITQFEDFIAYAVDKIGEAQTRRLGNYLTMVGQSVGMKGVRPTKDVLGVPMTQEQYVQLSKETFASVPAEQVEAGIEAAMLVLPQTAVGFAPAGSPVPGQGLMQGDFDQPADYEFTESDYRPAVVAYARDKWGSEVAANGKPTWQNFVRWFDDSAVVDKDGKPLVVYHGTSRKFDVFDVKKLGEEHGDNSAYLGFYFSEDKGVAKSYGGKDLFVISAFLSIKNPYLMPWEEFEQFEMNEASKEDAIALRKQLIADGYDGIQIEDTPDVVAFWPEQIKSAIANVGTFDPNNPNMLMQQQSQGGNVKGWTKFISGTRALIGATSKADISTVIHEFAHPIRRFLLDKSVPQNKRFDITDEEIDMLADKCGVKNGNWDVEAEEKFARMWEQYWFDGESPNSVLDSLFAKISRWMQQVYSSITAITGQPLDPEVRKLFDKLVQRGLTPDQRAAGKKSGSGGTATPVTTSDDPWKQRLTSIANQVAELIRLRLGVPGLTEPSAETFKQWLDEAKQILSNDPTYAERLVKELAQSNRNVDNIDVAVLQIHFRHLNNQLEAASDRLFKAKEENDSVAAAKARLDTDLLVNQIEEFTDITKRAGTEAGRALVARKIALQSDFTLGSLLRKARIANAGEELSKDQISEMTELSKKIAELEGQLEKETQEKNDLERRLAAEQSIEDTKKEVGKPVRNTATNRASNGAKKFVGLFASIFGKKTDTGTLQQTEDEKMAEAAVELIQGYVDAGVYTFGDFMARFKRDIGMDVPMSAKVAIRKAWDDMKSHGDIPAPEMQERDSPELRRLARSILQSVVEAGIVEPDEVIDAVHESLQEVIEDITKRETMDAMSGYGQFYPASKDPNDRIIRDLKSQYQQMAKLDDMRQGVAPKRTGSERPEPSPEVRDLIRQVNEMKRSSKYFVTDPETQLKTIFQSTRTALRNRIYDLSRAINVTGTPIPGREGTEFEAEQAKQIAQYRKLRDELMAEYKRTFPRPGLTFEQRAAIAERAADRAIAELEKQLASGDVSPKGRAEPISTPSLEAKRNRLVALRAERDAVREMQNPKMTKEERDEKAYVANLLSRIADYEDRKQHGYFGPRPKKPPRDLSPREKELSKQLENIKDEFFRYAAEYRLKNMTPAQRAWDYTKETMHLSRAIMTSFDLSAVFRQGGIASFAHPKLAASSAKEMYYALRDGQEEFNTMDKISKDDLYAIAMQAGLSITTDSGKITRQEEAYMGRWAKWGIGKKGTKTNKLTRGALIPVSASARAYTTFLNSMRFRLFKHMVSNLGAGGQVTLDEAKVIASYVNAATGRAELGKFNQAAANLNMVFFAPRYVASRFQYLAMPFYLLPSSKVSGRVKKMIAMEYARFAIGVTSMLGLSVLLGSMLTDDEEEKPTVEFDPRSSDFMKLKIGETRIDPMAGLSQTVTLIGQLATGQKKGLRGDIQDLYGEKRKFGDPDLWDVTTGFLRKKLAPIPGAIVDLRVGENVIGEKETPLTTGLDLFVPLSFQEAGETFRARGLVGGAGVVALSLLGMGGGTYGPRTAYATGDSKKREELFKKDLERVKWDSPDPAYKDFLTTEQFNKFNKQREGRKQALVYAASADPKRKEYVSDESFKQSVAERDKALDAVIKAGMGYEEIKQLLIAYYKRNYGSAYETRGGNYQMKESLTNRLRAIRRKMNEKQPAKT